MSNGRHHYSRLKLLIVFLVLAMIIAPASSISASAVSTPSWLFKGAFLNYSWTSTVKDVTYNNRTNVTSGSYSVELVYIFNLSDKINYDYNMTFSNGVNNGGPGSINDTTITDSPSGQYLEPLFAGGFFPPVSPSILQSLNGSKGPLFFNFFNSTSPLNVSTTQYSFHSHGAKAYEATASEGGSIAWNNSTKNFLHIRHQEIVVDAYSGVILYLNYNEITANNQSSINVTAQLNGTNVPLGIQNNESVNYLVPVIIAVIVALIFTTFIYRKTVKGNQKRK